MTTIRIRTTLASATLVLPQLHPLIGRPVQIVVEDMSERSRCPSDWLPGFWDTLKQESPEDLQVRPDQGEADCRDRLL